MFPQCLHPIPGHCEPEPLYFSLKAANNNSFGKGLRNWRRLHLFFVAFKDALQSDGLLSVKKKRKKDTSLIGPAEAVCEKSTVVQSICFCCVM